MLPKIELQTKFIHININSMKATFLNRALLAVAVFTLSICLANARGGNCKNNCEAAIDELKECKKEECTQVCNITISVDEKNNCVCPSRCQSCFDDVVGTDGGLEKKTCRGCTNKEGYNFDKDVLPKLQKEAEAIGCTASSGGTIYRFNVALALLGLVSTYFLL